MPFYERDASRAERIMINDEQVRRGLLSGRSLTHSVSLPTDLDGH